MRKIVITTLLFFSVFIAGAQNWYSGGFKISSNLPLNRNYSESTSLTSLRNLNFLGFFRAGKYVYGEIGIGYHYFKGSYNNTLQNSDYMMETRYFLLPVKVVGDVKISKAISFLPQVGISYQPLLKATGDVSLFDKSNVQKHWTLFTAGFDFRLGYILLGVDYRVSLNKFFRNEDGQKPQFINICAGVQF